MLDRDLCWTWLDIGFILSHISRALSYSRIFSYYHIYFSPTVWCWAQYKRRLLNYFCILKDIFIFQKIFLNIFLADWMVDLASQEDGQPWMPSECLICIIQSVNAYFQNNFQKHGRPVKDIIDHITLENSTICILLW